MPPGDELRRRLDAGELSDHPPIDPGNELTLSRVERAVRRMLADVEMFRAMEPAEREPPHYQARRLALADNLGRLREWAGECDDRG